MPQQTTTMAAPSRAAQARVNWVERCPEIDDFTPTLSGWRVGPGVAVVFAVLVLVAAPVLAALDPALAGRAAGWLERLAAVVPVMAGIRALVFVVAAVVISMSDGRP